MPSTNANNPDCPNCNKSGLAILPVRYAVVPHSVDAKLPEPLGNKVTDVQLTHHKYALRTLRQGFVYLYYEKHARGSQIKWEIYSVSPSGTLWKQLSTSAIRSISDEPTCSLNGHNIPASVIAIERPEKCGRVWMAFSEHAWSMETFALFEKDVKARDRRMQTFNPAKWIAAGGYRHGLEANDANLGEILEYKEKLTYNAILPTAAVPDISKPDGSFVAARLEKQTTRYPFYNRNAQKNGVVELMKKAGDKPVVVALWDAVGITHELAGFCHDVLGWTDKYSHERELELGAMTAIEGLKNALPEKAAALEMNKLATVYGPTAIEHEQATARNARRRAKAMQMPEPKRSQTLEVCDILDGLEARGQKASTFESELDFANELPEPQRSVKIDRIRGEAEEIMALRRSSIKKAAEKARATAWTKYEAKVDKVAYEKFKRNHDALLNTAERILEDRTEDLLAWLESQSLIAALSEFHTEDIVDGLVFDQQIGEAIYGLNGSVQGGAKLDEWVCDMKAHESNLLWRSVALNQKQAMDELESVLAEAREHQTKRTLASTLNWTTYTTKSLKTLADTYKKTSSFQNANAAATAQGGSKAFGVVLRAVNMRGIDKLVSTAGDRLFKAFSAPGLADHASEKIIQHIFSIRAFVEPMDSIELIKAQAANAEVARGQQLSRLRTARAFLAADTPEVRTAQSEALGKAWNDFKTTNSKATSAMKDARLALLVMLIEGVNFSKLLADCTMKNDAKNWWSLTASGLTITSNLFEIASTPAKSLFGGESWSYQRIKLAGGFISSAASAIGAILDIREAAKFSNKGNRPLYMLYLLKAALGAINVGLTVATTFTYAAPVIGRLTGNASIGAATRAVGVRAAAIIGVRILFMSAGAWITVIGFGIQIFIWVILDDALEEWCSMCAFGGNRTSAGAYRTVENQSKALQKALQDISS